MPVREAIKRLHELPTLPSSLAQVINTANDPEASALDLGRFIAADQSLSATLLRLVNSSYYGFYRQISSVTTAIVILGFLEVRNLVFASTTIRTFPESAGGHDLGQLWRHALATGMAAERASRIMRTPIGQGPFIAGLLHDIGRVALLLLYPADYGKVLADNIESDQALIEHEEKVFGCSHAEVGALLAEQWNLPDAIIAAVRWHHAPEKCPIDPDIAYLTAVSNYIAHAAGFGLSVQNPLPYPEHAALQIGLTPEKIELVRTKIVEAEASISELTGMMRT